ncbi:MAG TPA: hypothetical protein VJ864_08240, partial [Candidatus Binatia bacterium]|nr:hypothetical protein [Candidatus Binatia bacterium]
SHELSRGIFAILMTLLILEIHVPNLPPDAPNAEVAGDLLVTFVKPGILLGRPSHYVPRHPARRSHTVDASIHAPGKLSGAKSRVLEISS